MTVHAPLPQHTQTAAKRGVWEVIKDYMMTTDHKKIGLLYIIVSVLGFCLGGLLALAIRVQLALPEQTPLVGTAYNQVLTMHAAIMLFFFLIPLGLFGFRTDFLPLQLGDRDVPLHRAQPPACCALSRRA